MQRARRARRRVSVAVVVDGGVKAAGWGRFDGEGWAGGTPVHVRLRQRQVVALVLGRLVLFLLFLLCLSGLDRLLLKILFDFFLLAPVVPAATGIWGSLPALTPCGARRWPDGGGLARAAWRAMRT